MIPASPGKTILVAGGTGFLGSAVVRRLAERGQRVAVLSRSPESVASCFPGLDVEARGGDVTDPSSLPHALRGISALVQAVQFPGSPVEDPSRGRTFMEVDARGTANIVAACAGTAVERIVYLSGLHADPGSTRSGYLAKGMAEEAVRNGEPEHVVLRPSWVYGPGDRSLNLFARILRLLPGFFPQLGPGDQRINPVWIGDVAELTAWALASDRAPGSVIEIGGPVVYSMDAIIQTVMDRLGLRKPILHVPVPLLEAGAAVAELLPGQLLSRGALEFLLESYVANLGELRRLCPELELTPFPEALARYQPGERP